MTLKEMLYDENGTKKTVTFSNYFNGDLWYETEDMFRFPVPISETGTATFKATDYAVFFMKWIRKHRELMDSSIDELVDLKLNK